MEEITSDNNFCRVFQMPKKIPAEFCHNGGHPTLFRMVDWFNPAYQETLFKGPYIYNEEKLKLFIKGKRYYDKESQYVVITDFGAAFLVYESHISGEEESE